jgi:uncharacterized BrkB/YihY/UPF0761 family membrane protein
VKIVERARRTAKRASDWIEQRRPELPIVDTAMRFWERDREIDGSVIGSAIAMRVFLFFIPLLLVAVGLLGFFGGSVSSGDAAKEAGVTGGLAKQLDTALQQSSGTRWTALLTGLFIGAWAGRTLSKTLASASRHAWQLPTPPKAAVRVVGAIAGTIVAIGLLTAVVNRLRQAAGLAVGATLLLACAAAYAFAWFVVMLFLPRARSDATALLPGAVLVGAGLAVMQGIVQFYIPDRLSHASQLYGSIGVTIVTLGWFFLIGRLMVASFVLNAVVWERFGSLSELVFRLPLLRAIPKRWPNLFTLDDDGGTAGGAPTGE